MKEEGILELYPSIYADYILSKKKEYPMKSRLFLSILIMDNIKAAALLQHINEFVASFNSTADANSRYSGLLLAKENLLILFLESNNHYVNEFLKWLKSDMDQFDIQNKSTVLALNEEFATRVFEYWGTERLVNSIVLKFDAEKTEQETEQIVWEAYQKFLTAGSSIARKLKEEGRFTQPVLREAVNYVQLNAEELSMLVNDHYPNLSDYFDIYFSRDDVPLDAQNVWPAEGYVSQIVEYFKEPYNNYNGVR